MPLRTVPSGNPSISVPDRFCVKIRLQSSWICALLWEVWVGEGHWDLCEGADIHYDPLYF